MTTYGICPDCGFPNKGHVSIECFYNKTKEMIDNIDNTLHHSTPPGENKSQVDGSKDLTEKSYTIGKTVKDLPDNPTWDDIFNIGTGIPTGTQNMFRIYFDPPKRK